MRLAITQGHEKGIGLEVLFKTILLLPEKQLRDLIFFGFKQTAIEHLKLLKVPFEITDNAFHLAGKKISAHWLKNHPSRSQSMLALEQAVDFCLEGHTLFTLPTSKDQLEKNPGHTEYFRKRFHKSHLGMFFSSPRTQLLLITDHKPIKDLPKVISSGLVRHVLLTARQQLHDWGWPTQQWKISGLNPHAGEKGQIGTEESKLEKLIEQLRVEEKFNIHGPFPGDTLWWEKKSKEDVLVYLFHDQGLGPFKACEGFIGSNITLGLPFPRFSPDHGTSFSLFGKNLADHRGCEFSLKQALDLNQRLCHG